MSERLAMLPEVATIDDLYRYLPLGKSRIYELVRSGQIRSVRCGRRLLIPRAAVEEWLGEPRTDLDPRAGTQGSMTKVNSNDNPSTAS